MSILQKVAWREKQPISVANAPTVQPHAVVEPRNIRSHGNTVEDPLQPALVSSPMSGVAGRVTTGDDDDAVTHSSVFIVIGLSGSPPRSRPHVTCASPRGAGICPGNLQAAQTCHPNLHRQRTAASKLSSEPNGGTKERGRL